MTTSCPDLRHTFIFGILFGMLMMFSVFTIAEATTSILELEVEGQISCGEETTFGNGILLAFGVALLLVSIFFIKVFENLEALDNKAKAGVEK